MNPPFLGKIIKTKHTAIRITVFNYYYLFVFDCIMYAVISPSDLHFPKYPCLYIYYLGKKLDIMMTYYCTTKNYY